MAQITITRALSQLKSIEKRITGLASQEYVTARPCTASKESLEKVHTTQLANYNAVNDLAKQHIKLKLAIQKSNLETVVTISGTKMSVAEAIETKNFYVKQLSDVLMRVSTQLNTAQAKVRQSEEAANRSIEEQLRTNKDSSQQLLDEVRKNQLHQLVAFSGIDATTESVLAWKEQVQAFLEEVDFALSESNAVTTVEV